MLIFEPEHPGRVDALLERAYARFGRRLPLVSLGAIYVLAGTFAIVGVLTIARVQRLTSHETLGLVALAGLLCVAAMTVCLAVSITAMRPLAAWFDDGRDRSRALEAWRSAHGLPVRLIRRHALVTVPLMPIGLVAALGVVTPLSPALVVVAALGALGVVALELLQLSFAVQLAMRPLIRDVARDLDAPPPPGGGVGVQLKLLAAVPVITLAAVLGAVIIGAHPGVAWSEVLWRIVVACAGALLLVLPAAVLLALSALQPLEDLTRAAERLKHGDFCTRVPELSADEYGVLARSFNEAMEGLAERQRLSGENGRLLGEVRASRARIVSSSDAERRRIERNIHDGAQQRLVAHALELRMLREVAGTADPDTLRAMIDEACANIGEALAELRELARGLHPPVLATDGLPPALRQLAARSPIPVTVVAPPGRYPEAVESAAYFIACEALANVAKHARASRADVHLTREAGRLVMQIADDGVGGARPEDGSGLVGLGDRVSALDGTLACSSPENAGTTLTVSLPLADEWPSAR